MSTVADKLNAPSVEVERDRWGRPLIIQADGTKKAYTRATTFIKVMDDTYQLQLWSQRRVARGLATREDLLLAAQSIPDEYAKGLTDDARKVAKRELNNVCKDAMEASASSAKATIGTAVHRIAERIDRGESVTVPEVAKADIDAYVGATRRFRKYMIEELVVQDDLCVAGTPDRVLNVDGEPVIGDLKTGSVDHPGQFAMQLALYANSLRYNIATGERLPFEVNKERGLIIHLPAGEGTCELIWVDLRLGWEACLVAKEVNAWRKQDGLSEPYVAPPDPLLIQIAEASTADDLSRLYQSHKNRWTPELTEAAKARKAELTAGEETDSGAQ